MIINWQNVSDVQGMKDFKFYTGRDLDNFAFSGVANKYLDSLEQVAKEIENLQNVLTNRANLILKFMKESGTDLFPPNNL